MKFDSINKWLTLIGNVGVIFGILFLAIELQQANRIAISTAESDIRSKYMDLGSIEIENPELLEAQLSLSTPGMELTPIQDMMIRRYVRSSLVFFMGVEAAHDSGLMSESTFYSYLNVATATLEATPELAPYFVSTLRVRPDDEQDNVMVAHILEISQKVTIGDP